MREVQRLALDGGEDGASASRKSTRPFSGSATKDPALRINRNDLRIGETEHVDAVFLQEVALRRVALQALPAPIDDEDVAVRLQLEPYRRDELTSPTPALAKREKQFIVGGEYLHARPTEVCS